MEKEDIEDAIKYGKMAELLQESRRLIADGMILVDVIHFHDENSHLKKFALQANDPVHQILGQILAEHLRPAFLAAIRDFTERVEQQSDLVKGIRRY